MIVHMVHKVKDGGLYMEENNTLFSRFVKDFHKGDVIFEQNAAGIEMYIVQSGKVKLLIQDNKIALATLGPGEILGEMTLIDGSPRSATAIAEEDTRLIALDRPKFLYLVNQQPNFAFTIMRILTRRIRRADQTVTENVKKEA